MTSRDCLQLLREIKDVVFATVDSSGLPQARIIDIMLVETEAEREALYFLTARGKDFYAELMATGRVAVSGMTRDWRMVRLNGHVRKLDDRAWIDRMFEANPSMNEVYPGTTRDILEPFCLYKGQGEILSLAAVPIVRESFQFGGEGLPERGYRIGHACVECGTCLEHCPEHCIEPGSPYVITARHCLHCGACAEHCPVNAVERLGAVS